MGFTLEPLDLLATAKRLAKMRGTRPRQTDLKRATSTVYYALFHALCRNSADCLIGTKGADRSNPAWNQAYRSVGHGYAMQRCDNKKFMNKFPKEIEDFGNEFVAAQMKRHSADYDPDYRISRFEVLSDITSAEIAIKAMKPTKIKDRRAFAAWVTLINRS